MPLSWGSPQEKSGHMSGKIKQPKHKMSAMAKKEERTAWLFIALPFLGFLLFMAYPICFAVFASMSKWTGMNSLVDNFCGLQNYINIFHDEKPFDIRIGCGL